MTAAEVIEILSEVPGDTVVDAESSGGEFVRVEHLSTIEFADGEFSATFELG